MEIGFGTGHTLAVLVNAVGSGGMVCGLDLPDRMVRLAKKDLADARLLKGATTLWRRGAASLCRVYAGSFLYGGGGYIL